MPRICNNKVACEVSRDVTVGIAWKLTRDMENRNQTNSDNLHVQIQSANTSNYTKLYFIHFAIRTPAKEWEINKRMQKCET